MCASPRPQRIKPIIGQQFGRLIALERLSNGDHVCSCVCGNRTTVIRGNLTRGGTRSCGCLRIETIKRERSKPNSRELAIARYYRRNAKVRHLPWNIPQELFERLLHLPCDYCGKVPALGIDRIDSSMGYEAINVVPCCMTCNCAKLAQSRSDF